MSEKDAIKYIEKTYPGFEASEKSIHKLAGMTSVDFLAKTLNSLVFA